MDLLCDMQEILVSISIKYDPARRRYRKNNIYKCYSCVNNVRSGINICENFTTRLYF